jgi:hypothetical protein
LSFAEEGLRTQMREKKKEKKISSRRQKKLPRTKLGKSKAKGLGRKKVNSSKSDLSQVKNLKIVKSIDNETLPPVTPFLGRQLRPKSGRTIGYYIAASFLSLLGVLFLTQNDVREEASPANENGPVVSDTSMSPRTPAAADKMNSERNSQIQSQKSNAETSAQQISGEDKIYKGPLAEEFKLALGLTLAERVALWSSYIIGGGQHLEAISKLVGNTQVDDIVPIIPKHYDCTTFVETVSALALSDSPGQFVPLLLGIRYKEGKTDFTARNHFTELDWIPNNRKAGILTDVTQAIAKENGLPILVSRKEINRQKWLIDRAKKEGVPDERLKSNDFSGQIALEAQVPYIKIDQIKSVIGKIPDGSILNFVHNPDRRHDTVITHQAILVSEGGKYYLRHASKTGLVRSNEIFSYLKKQQGLKTSWPLIGININQLRDSSSSSNRLNETM